MSEILLDSSQGELEVLIFKVAGVSFAINVAKIQEIVVKQHVTKMPLSPKGVRGIFNIRDGIYTVIDLGVVLFEQETELNDKIFYILCNFNNQRNAFIVDDVEGIKRVAWKELQKPSGLLNDAETSNVIGILNLEDNIVSVLDFEKIVTDINPNSGLKVDTVKVTDSLKSLRGSYTILVADDSKMINRMLVDTISNAGYKVLSVEDGQQALDAVLGNSKIDLLVVDCEMPIMDGLEASRLIREKEPDFPIILFSSLVNEALKRKVANLKLNDAISKPEIGELVERIDKIVINEG